MRILLVSYYFPPAAGGGVQRVLKWAKYLPQFGVEVDVLTPDDPGWIDSGGGLEVPPGTTVHRTRNRSPRSLKPNEELLGTRGVRRLFKRAVLLPRRLLVPDMHVGWALSAVPAGCRIVAERKIDLIVSTSPPETGHLVAARIARRTGVPWIADFRDSWLDLPHLRTDRALVRLKHAVNTRLARRLFARAQAATTVSEPLAADLRRRFPQLPVHVISNGVDLDDLEGLPIVRESGDGRFLMLYTGNFFGRQSPATFLEALAALLQRRPELRELVSMRFVGGLKPGDAARIDGDELLASCVERVAFLDYRDVLAWQAAADLLFLYVAPGPGSAGVFTGKVFEYIAAGRPILALAPADNVAAQLVLEADAGEVVDPADVAAIGVALERAVDAWREGGTPTLTPPVQVMDRISRAGQARALAELVRATLN